MHKILKLTLLLVTFINYGQNKFLHKSQLTADLNQYIETLEKTHIGLYRYTSKEEFKRFSDSINNTFRDSLDIKDFYKKISLINSKIRCGHSKVSIEEWWKNENAYIPFSLYSINNKVYIWHDVSLPYLNLDNKELIAINGISIQDVLSEIRQYMSVDDGFVSTRKKVFSEKLFPLFYSKFFELNNNYEIVIGNEDGTQKNINIPAIKYKELLEISKDRYPNNEAKNLTFINKHEENYAYLKINSFYVEPIKFEKTIDSIFLSINNQTKHLIVDLRENTGGKVLNENHLLSYMTTNNIKTHMERKYLNKKGRIKKLNEDIIKSNPNSFKGNLYFLMDGYTFSAASEFLSIAKHYNLGTFIGEETGGAEEGCNYGGKLLVLTNSKISCAIPYYQSVFKKSSSENGRGIIPSHQIEYTRNEIKNNVDSVLEYTIKLINKS